MESTVRSRLLLIATLSLLSINLVQIISASNAIEIPKKLDCHPLDRATRESCEKLGCIWEPVDEKHDATTSSSSDSSPAYEFADGLPKPDVREPWCHFPEDYLGYEIIDVRVPDNGSRLIRLRRTRPSGLPNDIVSVDVSIEQLEHALRIRIVDSNQVRFEPALPSINEASEYDAGPIALKFKINIDAAEGLLEILRPDTYAVVFRTDLRRLIFSDKFHQLNTDLSSDVVFGLGEHYDNFVKRVDKQFKAYSYYATDKLPLPEGRRSYGSFPFLINPEATHNGKLGPNAHGVYLRNSNGMEIVLQPDQSVTYRVIGGIFDFFIFPGPHQNEVVKQYQNLVGKPELPPRWALGFQLCRYNYGSIEKLNDVWNRTYTSGIPFDVQWTDIDTMLNGNDFSYDSDKFRGLPEFVDRLHELNMHYVPILDPGLSQEANYRPYELGLQLDGFVKNSSDQLLVGHVWNRSNRTVFVDFSGEGGQELWRKLFEEYHEVIKLDGAWIDMNEVSNFVDGSIYGCPNNEPSPYSPGGYDIMTKTMCPDAKHSAGRDYDIHNIYAFYEAIATRNALLSVRPDKRPFVISRASSPGQGHFSGHWSGDILSSWDYLRWTMASSIEHSMYGFNMMGHDICGFVGDTTPELCARWHALGAFYTFSRNHNDDTAIDQDPVILGPDVLEATRNAFSKRYYLLPLLYNLIHRAHRFGEPAIRSTAFEYYHLEPESLNAEEQMMWGDKMIVSPVVEQGSTSKKTYLPAGRWFEFNVLPVAENDGIQVPKMIETTGQWHETRDISLRDIPIFLKAGNIIPVYRQVSRTIPETVNQAFGLDIFLNRDNRAIGELYVDDGESIDSSNKLNHLSMQFANRKLRIEMNLDDYRPKTSFGRVVIYNIPFSVDSVISNGRPISFSMKEGNSLVFDLQEETVSRGHPLEVELVSNTQDIIEY